MASLSKLLANKHVVAWVLMVTAMAIHVADETLTDFLPFYNQLVSDVGNRYGLSFLPTFTYGQWLGGLIVAIVAGFAVTPLVYRGGRILRIVTTALGILMIVNACGHMIGSVYFGRLLPGFWSSPLLLISAFLVVVRRVRDPGGGRSLSH
jgi:hypothetical protein